MVIRASASRELGENTTDGAALLARRAISLLSAFVAESYKWTAQARPAVNEVAFEAIPNDLVSAFISDEPAEFPPCCAP